MRQMGAARLFGASIGLLGLFGPRRGLRGAPRPGRSRSCTRLAASGELDQHSPLTSEETVNQLGYDLLAARKAELAIEAFLVNTELYPKANIKKRLKTGAERLRAA